MRTLSSWSSPYRLAATSSYADDKNMQDKSRFVKRFTKLGGFATMLKFTDSELY
jgi:hypothetical protein